MLERTVLLDDLKLLKMGRKIKPVQPKSQLETDTEIDKTADQPKASSSSTPEVHSQHVKPEVSVQEPEGLVIPILEERNPISERLEELKDLSNTAGTLYTVHCTAIPSISLNKSRLCFIFKSGVYIFLIIHPTSFFSDLM